MTRYSDGDYLHHSWHDRHGGDDDECPRLGFARPNALDAPELNPPAASEEVDDAA